MYNKIKAFFNFGFLAVRVYRIAEMLSKQSNSWDVFVYLLTIVEAVSDHLYVSWILQLFLIYQKSIHIKEK